MADDLIGRWTRDWRRLRHQKHRVRGGVEAAMLLDLLLYEGEHQSLQVQNAIMTRAFKSEDKNKLRLMIPLARRLANRKIGRLWSVAHRFRATPNVNDPIAFDNADVIGDQLLPACDFKVQQDTLRWILMKWIVICGVVFEHCDWKDNVTVERMPKYVEGTDELLWQDKLTGAEVSESDVQLMLSSGQVASERFAPAVEVQGEGDFGADVYDPFRVFMDASVPQVKMLGPDQRIYLFDIRTVEWIKETFGAEAASGLHRAKDLSIIETQLLDRGIPLSGLNLKDLLPLIHGSQDKDDPDMCLVGTVYQPPHEEYPNGMRGFFVPDQKVLDVDECPYPEVPVVDFHWAAPGATLWTPGFVRDMHSLSKFIDKRFSQLGEAANAQIYEMLLLHPDLKAKDIPTDFPGVVNGGVTDEGLPKVQVVPRGNLPSFFPESIRLSMETLDAVGSSDLLSQRKFPGQLRGSLAIPMVQEILDSEDGPVYSHLAEQFAREKQMRINRIKAFYPPIRTLNYTGQDLRNEVLEFHAEEVLRAGVDFTVTVDPGSILPELSSMREARVRERFQWAPGLYTNPRTGTVDWSMVAQDLKYRDTQRESLATQARKLARQLIMRVRNGKLVPYVKGTNPETGKPQVGLKDAQTGADFIVYPFWQHNVMMDEYETVMQTTEFIDASPMYKRALMTLHEGHRQILAQIDQARQNAVNDKMMQSAVAQTTQQTAAQVASVAASTAVEQIEAQKSGFGEMEGMIRELMGRSEGANMRPQLPPGREPTPVGRRIGVAR